MMETVTIPVKVVPRASQNEVAGWEGEVVKIRLTAPPVEGKANQALLKFLAESLGIARAQIEIVAGSGSRRKLVRVRGVTEERLRAMLGKQDLH